MDGFEIDDDELALIAYRPEPFRFRRLADVLTSAEAAVHANGHVPEWSGALRQIADRKGDLTVGWRSNQDRERFGDFIEAAWRNAGEDGDDVEHKVLTA